MNKTELSPKVIQIYSAIIRMFAGGADLKNLTVSDITTEAGIGKGTAYEYFSNKEDMIAGALFHEMTIFCSKLEGELLEQNFTADRINLFLQKMEDQMAETSCFFKIIHMMQDNSELSCKMRELMCKKKDEEFLFIELLQRMLKLEVGAASEKNAAEFSFLMMSIYSQFFCFGMYLCNKKASADLTHEKAKELTCRNICRSIREFTEANE